MKRCAAWLLILCLICTLFAGCSSGDEAYVPTGDAMEYEEDYTGPTEPPTEEEPEGQVLSLTYYPEISLNPYKCRDYTNRVLFSLLYQGLFATNRDNQVLPILCKNYRMSRDMRIYTFYIEENVTFSDGTRMTIQDVLDSLLAAKESPIYSGRFLQVEEIRLSDDEKGITMKLSTPYENLPLLLDVPILKSNQVEHDAPVGTGPYFMRKSGLQTSLIRRKNWWCESQNMVITADVIPLSKAESVNQIRDNFQFGTLDVVCADPGSDRYADYRCDFELWDCETGIFLYLVIGDYSKVFKSQEMRTALTYAIDRELLAQEYYRGFAQAASLPASPSSPYYSPTLAARYSYNKDKFAQVVQNTELGENTVKLLVNGDDSLRTRVARAIAAMLTECGLVVEVQALTGYAYTTALNNWEFDLYLGQTMLSPNMDLTQFFFTYGTLRQGGISDVNAYTLCQQALENHGNYYTLHQTVMDNGMLCPILFRSYAIYATRGLVTDLQPARDNIFCYSVGKTMEDVYSVSE